MNDFQNSPAEIKKLLKKSHFLWRNFLEKNSEKFFSESEIADAFFQKNLEKIAENAAIFSGKFRGPTEISSPEISKIVAISKNRRPVSREKVIAFLQKQKLSPARFSPAFAEKMFFETTEKEHFSDEKLSKKSPKKSFFSKNPVPKKTFSTVKIPDFSTEKKMSFAEKKDEKPRNFQKAAREVSPKIEKYLEKEAKKVAEKQKIGGQKKVFSGFFGAHKKKKKALLWATVGVLGTASAVAVGDTDTPKNVFDILSLFG